MIEYALLPLLSYLLGAVPFGYLLVRVRRGIDIRTIGSGNLGATNVARALGMRWFAVVFTLDFLKGFVSAFVLGGLAIRHFEAVPWITLVYGLCAVFGHNWPVYLKFKGGKGVATAGGAVVGSTPLAAVFAVAAFAMTFLATRYVSLGSIMASIALPVAYFFMNGMDPADRMFQLLLFIMVLVIAKHRTNIGRIIAGTESKAIRKKS